MSRLALRTLLVAALLLLGGAARAATLTDADEVDDLALLFNKDEGTVRIVLLMSPT